jgi:hypothetical protein
LFTIIALLLQPPHPLQPMAQHHPAPPSALLAIKIDDIIFIRKT